MKLHSQMDNGFYGKYARFLLFFCRNFTHKYDYIPYTAGAEKTPAVYVCRHLNMHGPYACIKWLPFSFHPMILSTFFERESTENHLCSFTLSEKKGKKVSPWNRFVAWLAGIFFPPLIHSLQAVPVHRDSHSVQTFRTCMQHLQAGEPLAVWPDIAYTAKYGKESEIYHGFLYLGELYHRRTGKSLPFIPLVVDDENHRLVAGSPIYCDNYHESGDAAAEALKHAINGN